VWKLGKNVEFVFDDQRYEIPKETSLKIGSVLLMNNSNLEKAAWLRNASEMIKFFKKNYLSKIYDFDQLKLEVLESRNYNESCDSLLLEDHFPEELFLTEEEKISLGDNYKEWLESNNEIFESLKQWRASFLKTAVGLFKKYESGKEVISTNDEKKILTCLLGERFLAREIGDFVKRIREEKYDDRNLLRIVDFFNYCLDSNVLKKEFSLFDLLEVRDKLYLERYRRKKNGFSDEMVRRLWFRVNEINREDILRRIRSRIIKKQGNKVLSEIDMEVEVTRYLQNKSDPLVRDFRNLKELDLLVEKEIKPEHQEKVFEIVDRYVSSFDLLVSKRLRENKGKSLLLRNRLNSALNLINKGTDDDYLREQREGLDNEDIRVVLAGVILCLCPKSILKENLVGLSPKKRREKIIFGFENFLSKQGIDYSGVNFRSRDFVNKVNLAIDMLDRYKSLAQDGPVFERKYLYLKKMTEVKLEDGFEVAKSDPVAFMLKLEREKNKKEGRLKKKSDWFKERLDKLRNNGLLREISDFK
jgi:hypothetical protein